MRGCGAESAQPARAILHVRSDLQFTILFSGALQSCRLHEYDYKTSFFGDGAPLSQAVGYPLVIGVAALFVVLTVGLFWLDRHYAGTE